MSNLSIVYWYSDSDKHRCGYCKSEKGNISHGMWAQYLTVEDYQNLIDRGWRRSGQYCYKPIMNEVCCPMYTIKCNAVKFQLSKSQKRVIKKFNKFLGDGILPTAENEEYFENSNIVHKEAPKILEIDSNVVGAQGEYVTGDDKPSTSITKVPVKNGIGADPSKPPCKKAKLLRLERKQEKLMKRGVILNSPKHQNTEKRLEEFLNESGDSPKHKLRLQIYNTNDTSDDTERLKQIEFEIYKKYQLTVHNDPPDKCTMQGFLRFLVNSPLQVSLERLDVNHDLFRLTAKLFSKYQRIVHNEEPNECDESLYDSFLVKSPLQYVKFSNDSVLGFGSFHQLYWLDDALIAVGVIDILPKCVSSVYFFYDPDFRDLTLGTYGSLQEVAFTRNLHQQVPTLQSYYMGFYIHSCPKMRYKGKLAPSSLLCPETYQWTAIERCLPKLEISKYSKLEEWDKIDENSCNGKDIDEIKLLYNRKLTLFKSFKRKFGGERLMKQIGELVGRKCANSLIFVSESLDLF